MLSGEQFLQFRHSSHGHFSGNNVTISQMPWMAHAVLPLLLAMIAWARADYKEVVSTTIGPRNERGTNNSNSLDRSAPGRIHSNCDVTLFQQQYGRPPCANDMQWVCSRHFQISFCLDRDLGSGADGRPLGNLSRNSCATFCASQNKRLPTNNEWLVGCNATPFAKCLNYKGSWPPGHFAKIQGHPCQVHGATSPQCMTHPDLTKQLPTRDPQCVSEALVNSCVGTLGQWVSDSPNGNAARGKFNGGLFPQPASSVVYTTTAHGPGYSDYSIGCRCAKDI